MTTQWSIVDKLLLHILPKIRGIGIHNRTHTSYDKRFKYNVLRRLTNIYVILFIPFMTALKVKCNLLGNSESDKYKEILIFSAIQVLHVHWR